MNCLRNCVVAVAKYDSLYYRHKQLLIAEEKLNILSFYNITVTCRTRHHGIKINRKCGLKNVERLSCLDP